MTPALSSNTPDRIVPCPACGGDSVYSARNAHRPFCSARCKNVDWGAWASEAFRVATPPSEEAGDAGDPGPHLTGDNA
jgi:uncharacterized protein